MEPWTPFPHRERFRFDRQSLRRHWGLLHACDQEPLCEQPHLLDAWALFHNGQFEHAYRSATVLGPAGANLASKAASTYAHYLEPHPGRRLALLQQAADRAAARMALHPGDANAHYLHALALARYGEGISVAQGLAQGLGNRIKQALESAIRLQPQHAEACIALGAFHADVIDKVGPLIGAMTYGAKRERSLELLQRGLHILPNSALALTEYAGALLALDGDQRRPEACTLFLQASTQHARDALEYLQTEAARARHAQVAALP